MSNYTQAPVPVRHARLLNILNDIARELDFSNFADENTEADESIQALLGEAQGLVRSLQKGSSTPSGQNMDMTMVPE